MKKGLVLSLVCCSLIYGVGFVNPLPTSSRALENGGTLSAIDAYQDGVGAMVSQDGRGIDNSAMNALVFKYGNEAKDNNINLCDQVVLSGNNGDKILNSKLCVDGTNCNDGLSNTINDAFVSGSCVGKIVTSPICADVAMVWNGGTQICEKGGISTYTATGNSGALSWDNCEGGTGNQTYGSNYCASKGMRLPSISEAISRGGTIPSCPGNWTWTSTFGGMVGPWVWSETSESGHIASYAGNSVRCVGNIINYTCPSGGTLSGTTCTINTYQSASGICQAGYTLNTTLGKCVQN